MSREFVPVVTKGWVLALALLLAGCSPGEETGFSYGESKLMFDMEGRAYHVSHNSSDSFRVIRVPEADTITEEPTDE